MYSPTYADYVKLSWPPVLGEVGTGIREVKITPPFATSETRLVVYLQTFFMHILLCLFDSSQLLDLSIYKHRSIEVER